jgi:hypothetical protein
VFSNEGRHVAQYLAWDRQGMTFRWRRRSRTMAYLTIIGTGIVSVIEPISYPYSSFRCACACAGLLYHWICFVLTCQDNMKRALRKVLFNFF